jgi:hypothetical protein
VSEQALPAAPPRRRRRRVLVALAVVAGLGTADLARPPAEQLSAHGLLAGLDLYQATVSRAMPALGVRCRFRPSCSRYAEGAIRRHGALGGSVRAAWRVMRCGPWTASGTVDPP